MTLRRLPVHLLLLSMLLIQATVPFAAASGMSTCTNLGETCDTYDGSMDGTPDQEDWIQGAYHFQMQDTSTIDMELSWIVREFNRSALGFDEPILAASLEFDGLQDGDGVPADLMRSFLDEPTAGPGSNTVGEELMASVNDSVLTLLTQGFGDVQGLSTTFVNSVTVEGVPTGCTTNAAIDAQSEGQADNNVFDPPICFSATATVGLDVGKFNLQGGPNLDIERAYEGLLVMGSEIRTDFSIFAEPGYRSTFLIEPPAFSDVVSVDANGSRVVMGDHFAGEWTIDNTQAPAGAGTIERVTSLTMGYRNTTETSVVTVEEGDPGFSLDLRLDLSDEQNAIIDLSASLFYVETALLEEWGIQVVQFSELADVPLLTADGLRLAHHNELVDLNLFTNAFPVSDIINGATSGIPGLEGLQMSELAWVSDTVAEGMVGPAGGLNYTHSTGCTEVGIVGVDRHYCLSGPAAMGYDHPVVLRSVSEPVNLRFLDLLSANVDDPMVNDFLTTVQDEDLRRLMDAGFAASINPPAGLLDDVVPSSLGGVDLQVTVVLPSWVVTSSGSNEISMTLAADGQNEVDISVRGPNPFQWDHQVTNDDGIVICTAVQRTCVSSSVVFDLVDVDVNEWRQSASVEFGLDVEVSMHRLAFLENVTEPGDPVHVEFDVIPSDLLRLIVDVASRMDEPLALSEPIMVPCEDFNLTGDVCDLELPLEFTEAGLTSFVSGAGEMVTALIQDGMASLPERMNENGEGASLSAVDFDAFSIETSLSGIGAPGTVVSDTEAITFAVTIPNVRIEVDMATSLLDVINGAQPEFAINTRAARAIASPVIQPMAAMMEGFARSMTSGLVASNGVTFPPPEQSANVVETGEVNTMIAPEFDLTLTGPISIVLPKGITVDATSQQGLLDLEMVDGRQQVTYLVPYSLDDVIEYRVNVGWLFIWSQIWVYPTTFFIIVALLFMGWRRRRKRKKARKAALKAAAMGDAAQKSALSDEMFAGYSGVNSTGMMVGNIDDL